MLGLTPVWTLDNSTNGDVDVILQSSICETAGQCGSGKGDLSVLIQTAALGTFGMNDYFVFYSEYGSAEAG